MFTFNSLKIISALISIFVVISGPTAVFAQPVPPAATSTATIGNVNLPTYSGVDDSLTQYLCTPIGDGQDLERCINRVYRFGIVAGALILVFMAVLAGYFYITGGETGIGKAKGIIKNSIVGMALLLGSYALLYFINPSLVAFKPIQPPIFEAGPLPDCEAVGYGESCLADVDEDVILAKTGGGTAIPCPDGLIPYDSSVPANANPSSARICKSLMEKLKAVHAKHSIIVTSTIRSGGALSLCHKSDTAKTGSCADMASRSGDWDGLCRAIKEVGGLGFLNESGKDSANCGKFVKTKYWTGAHLHVNLVGR